MEDLSHSLLKAKIIFFNSPLTIELVIWLSLIKFMLLFCYMLLVNIEELGCDMRNSNLFSQFFISAI